MKKRRFFVIGLFLLSIAFSAKVRAQTKADDKKSARIFVQKFYDWYMVLFDQDDPPKKGRLSSQQIVMKHSREFLSDRLRQALETYYRMPSKNDDIGLDFDPFANAQDTGYGYQTGNVKQAGNVFWVDVRDGKKGQPQKSILAADLILTAEVIKERGHWVIANLIYPAGKNKTNLLDLLKDQQKSS